MSTARDSITVRRVFGEPIVQDGTTVVPCAVVIGAMGGGTGQRGSEDEGSGGGFGVVALPVGAYRIAEGGVQWKPAVNVNLVVIAATIVSLGYLAVRFRRAGATVPGVER